MVVETDRLFLRSAADGICRFRRQAAAAAVAAIGLVTSPGVEAQTTLTVNGASGSNTISAAQSTTGGLVINQIFGVDYLIVGGGGGSGYTSGNGSGGGGAGGLLHNTGVGAVPLAFSSNSYTVTVGAGGAGGNNSFPNTGSNGANSVLSGSGISTLTAIGGGGGGGAFGVRDGSSGGSGGGGGGGSGAGGAGTVGQGNAGGVNYGRGGGAGQTGTAGGQGLQIDITGTPTYYAGGGQSAFNSSSVLGGGGGGSGTVGTAPQAGSANTGGGGGASWSNGGLSGARGGSGIAVLRYGGPVLPGLSTSVTSGSGSVTTSSYTDGNGVAQQVYSFTVGSSTTSGGFAFDMSGVSPATLDQRLGTILSNTITGDGGLTFNGPGRLTLSAVNTYSGTTSVAAGGLLLSGSVAGDVSIAAGARLGGSGGLGGSLALSPGSFLVFNPLSSGLQLGSGNNVTIDSTFSVDSLLNVDGTIIDWGAVADGTYILLANTTTNFSGVTNFGPGNAKDLGAGRSAYFQNGPPQQNLWVHFGSGRFPIT